MKALLVRQVHWRSMGKVVNHVVVPDLNVVITPLGEDIYVSELDPGFGLHPLKETEVPHEFVTAARAKLEGEQKLMASFAGADSEFQVLFEGQYRFA